MNDIIESLNFLKTEKNIARPVLIDAIRQAFLETLDKEHQEKYDVIINVDTGDLEIWIKRLIVEDGFSEDEYNIDLSEALEIEDDFTVGEEVNELITIESLGRRFVVKFKQNIITKIRNIDNIKLYNHYHKMIGELIEVNVEGIRRDLFIAKDYDGNDMILRKEDSINNEFLKKGEPLLACIKNVEMNNDKVNITLTRNSSEFLTSVFFREIPHVSDGLVDIKKVARIGGVKSYVFVDSYDDRIDPVGSCIGSNGNIIKNISRLVRGEKIEVIHYTKNNALLLRRMLKDIEIEDIEFNEESNYIFLNSASNFNGIDVKLASILFGMDIIINNNESEDVLLTEFSDEIDIDVIDKFVSLGFRTAKIIINNIDLIEEVIDLDKQTLLAVFSILTDEFEQLEDDVEDESEEV